MIANAIEEHSPPREIRGVFVPINGSRLLLPNAMVAEVITLSTPEPLTVAQDWLLGRIGWRGWRLPLVSFSILAELAQREDVLNSRATVLKALGGNPRLPFLAVVTRGFPRLTTLSRQAITPAKDTHMRSPVVRAEVTVGDDRALIPDMEVIEHRVIQALEQTA